MTEKKYYHIDDIIFDENSEIAKILKEEENMIKKFVPTQSGRYENFAEEFAYYTAYEVDEYIQECVKIVPKTFDDYIKIAEELLSLKELMEVLSEDAFWDDYVEFDDICWKECGVPRYYLKEEAFHARESAKSLCVVLEDAVEYIYESYLVKMLTGRGE